MNGPNTAPILGVKLLILFLILSPVYTQVIPQKPYVPPKKGGVLNREILRVLDKNGNRIDDELEKLASNASASAILILRDKRYINHISWVLSNYKIKHSLLDDLGVIIVDSISMANIGKLKGLLESYISFIEKDRPVSLADVRLNISRGNVPKISFSSEFIKKYVLFGLEPALAKALSRGITVGIVDTGVSLVGDLGSKLIYFRDITEESDEPVDYIGHGTLVASLIAGGVGSASGLVSIAGITNKRTKVMVADVRGNITLYVRMMPLGRVGIEIRMSNGTSRQFEVSGSDIIHFGAVNDTVEIYSWCYDDIPRTIVLNLAGGQTEKFSGVAEGVNIAVWKVFKGLNYESKISDIIVAINDILNVRDKYNITVVNLSIESSELSVVLDYAVERLAFSGISVVVPSGNKYLDIPRSENQIRSPGTAKYAITVSATNDDFGIALYSSYGGLYEGGYIKPDVAIFGGGYLYGSWVFGLDSDDGDFGFRDLFKNDFAVSLGTSFSVAIVSGIVAILTGYMIKVGIWRGAIDDVLWLKRVLLASSFELSRIGLHEYRDTSDLEFRIPPLDYGDKDYIEGFGYPIIPVAIDLLKIQEFPVAVNYSIGFDDKLVSGFTVNSTGLLRIIINGKLEHSYVVLYAHTHVDGSPKVFRVYKSATSEVFLGTGVTHIIIKSIDGRLENISVVVDELAKRQTLVIAALGLIVVFLVVFFWGGYAFVRRLWLVFKRIVLGGRRR